uniref:Acyl-CoA oxidase C-terminal domain-containing protein n=1 Tax=Vitis vinifera TaxID=29760 RepID=F6HAS2_VITVI
MHVLIILEEDASFLRYGYLSPDNAAGISQKVTILYSELRPHALALIQSLGVGNLRLSYKVMLQDGGKRLGCRYIHEQLNLSLCILSYSVFLTSLYII